MRMRHFPWLRFHMQGSGQYRPNQEYDVKFLSAPWFFSKRPGGTDLSMLDPVMWPQHYTYQQIGVRDGMALFTLHSLTKTDPMLDDATVALGPQGCARTVDAAFSDGTSIHMNITPSEVDGFLLPHSLTADIDEPHLSLSASADFKNYQFEGQGPLGKV